MNRYILGLVLFVTACAIPQQGSEGPVTVTHDEIQASGATTVYNALRVLRPRWLRSTEGGQQLLVTARAGERPPVVDSRCTWRVYVGETGYEGDELRRIQASSVREIRLIILPQRRRPDGSYCVHNHSYIHIVLIDATRDAALNVAQAQQDPKLEELDSLPVGLEVLHAPDPAKAPGRSTKGISVYMGLRDGRAIAQRPGQDRGVR